VGVSPDGSRVYVANRSSSTVSVIDTATNSVIGTVKVGKGPRAVVITPDGSRAYAANSNDSVSVIDTATNTVVDTFAVDPQPEKGDHYMAVGSDGTVYVVDTKDRVLRVITVS